MDNKDYVQLNQEPLPENVLKLVKHHAIDFDAPAEVYGFSENEKAITFRLVKPFAEDPVYRVIQILGSVGVNNIHSIAINPKSADGTITEQGKIGTLNAIALMPLGCLLLDEQAGTMSTEGFFERAALKWLLGFADEFAIGAVSQLAYVDVVKQYKKSNVTLL